MKVSTFRSLMTAAVVACAAGSASATWYMKDEKTQTVTNELGITFTVSWPSGKPTMSVKQVITLNGQTRVDLSEPCAPGCPPIVGIENNWGFKDQSTLKEVVFPSTMTTIGGGVFRGTSITNLDFSQTAVTVIGQECCYGLTTLTDVKLSPTLESIGNNAFYGCTSLTNVAPLFPATLKTSDADRLFGIGSNAFGNCPLLTGDVKLNCPNMTYLSGRAFQACHFTSVDMSGSGIEVLGTNNGDCFQNCKELTNVVLSSCLRIIKSNTFSGCTALKTITPFLPESVTDIGMAAFNSVAVEGELKLACPGLTNLVGNTFRNMSVTSIDMTGSSIVTLGEYEFNGNAKVEKIVLPESLVSLPSKKQVFGASSSLTAMYFRGKPIPQMSESDFRGTPTAKLRLYVPKGDSDWDSFLTTNSDYMVSWISRKPTAAELETFATLYPDEKLPKLMTAPTGTQLFYYVCRWWPNGAPGLSVIVK